MQVPAYKIASFELIDLPLLRCVAATGKPILLSTGMAGWGEIDEAVQAIRATGNGQLALLKCTSAYPSRPAEMNLRTIPRLAADFGVPVGLSDHSLEPAVPVAAVALGACIIEKHLTLSRNLPGPDREFSLEPAEFRQMVQSVRAAYESLGVVQVAPAMEEEASRRLRRSLFVVRDMRAGERFTADNVRSLRPAAGLPPRYFDRVIGQTARIDLPRGTPLQWKHIG
jgi:N-acetylneuraminate synthase